MIQIDGKQYNIGKNVKNERYYNKLFRIITTLGDSFDKGALRVTLLFKRIRKIATRHIH